MSEYKRSTTEIIIDLEGKVDNLLSYIKNIDHNYKLLLNKISVLDSKVSSGKVTVVPSMTAPTVTKPNLSATPAEIPSVPENVQKQVLPNDEKPSKWDEIQKKVLGQVEDTSASENRFELVESVKPKGKRRGSRVTTDKKEGSRTAVSQILTKGDRPILLAVVKISNEGSLVKKCRTNQEGRWSAALEPGSYQVEVTKTSSSKDVQSINEVYLVEIPKQDSFSLNVKEL